MKIKVKPIDQIINNFKKFDVILDENAIKEWDRYAGKEFTVKVKNGPFEITTYVIQDDGFKGDMLTESEIEM